MARSFTTPDKTAPIVAFDVVRDYVRAAQSVPHLEHLKVLTEGAVRALDFDYFAILHHLDLANETAGIVRFGNYPDGFREAVRAKRYVLDDPVLVASQRVAHGFLWSEVPRMMALNDRQRDIIALGAREGLGDGFTVPVHIPGEFLGSSSFGVRRGKEVRESNLPLLNYIGSFAFEAGRRIAMRKLRPRHLSSDRHAVLTERQLECIVLVARGHSARTAAKRLGIKQDTVEKHLSAAKDRVGVQSTSQLLVRALFDGRLTFHDLLSENTFAPS